MKECIKSRSCESSHGSKQGRLLQEWYGPEKSPGRTGETIVAAEDHTGHEQGETLIADWSFMWDAMEADKVLCQQSKACNQCSIEYAIDKIREFVFEAQWGIQWLVKGSPVH